VVTGNHYLVDALGGAVILAIGYGLARLLTSFLATIGTPAGAT
jgi:hypothetical protein